MYSYDFYTGEAVQSASPKSLSPPQPEISQQEVIQNAQLYNYNPVERLGFNPAMVGYNQQPGFTGFAGNPTLQYMNGFNFMNPPQQPGFAGNPALQYMNGNPALQYMNGFGVQMPPQTQQYNDYTYYVPGLNTGSTLLLNEDAEDICAELQTQMMLELEEANIRRMEQQKSYYSSLGYNYYGTPYVDQNYVDPAIINKYKKKIEDMREEAKQARTELNKKLSRLCHSYLGEEIDEDKLDEMYSGHVVTISAQEVKFRAEQARFDDLVPFDNSEMYRKHSAEVSNYYKEIFSESTDMNSFFRDCGQLIAREMTEEENHKRRDMSTQYKQDGSYRQLIRRKLMERNAQQNNGIVPQQNNIPFGEQFPTLAQSATLLDDGSLSITVPPWVKNKGSVVTNIQEDGYEVSRRKFIESIYNNDPRPGGGG